MNSLPTGWQIATLDELKASEPRAITDGPFGSNLTSAHYTSDGARVVRLQNIGDGFFNDARAYISMQHFEGLRHHEVVAGDVLIASLGEELPRACIAPVSLSPAIVKADCIRVRLSERVDPRWVMYAMQTPAVRSWAKNHLHGVGRPRLGLKVIRQIPVVLPPLDEQWRIVQILEDHFSRLDAAFETLSAVAARLRPLMSALLQKIVPAGEVNGWRLTTVGEAGQVQLGRQRHPDWHTGPEMKPYLRVANVFEDRIDTRDVMEMDFSGVFERYRLSPGDVLLNEGQSPEFLGRPAIYRGEPPDVAFTNSLIRFKANSDVLPEWALLVFRRHMHAGRFMKESRITTNIAHLSASRLKSVEFPVPPLEEQQALVDLANDRFSTIERIGVEISRRCKQERVLRRSLLEVAFSGRLTRRSVDHRVIEELSCV